jgi:asparagine synthase (glutamine-hydrolysing)
MCGIFGWVTQRDNLTPQRIDGCRRATAMLAHRGPDAKGEWQGVGIFMGHRRLSIIDLSEAATQPFHDDQGRYVLAFNGEIYNYLELRRELIGLGRTFRTKSDTEVLLQCLAEWGPDGLRRLDGMFAGALHDRRTGRHLLFRDPLGQKPLYYHCHDGGVIYASELRALLELPGMHWRIDREAFRRYLVHGYYPWRSTPVAGIEKLLPGCLMEIEDGKVKTDRWWDSVPGRDQLDIDFEEAVGEVERLFERSCDLSMRSDVPVGVFLSGGLDSSLVMSGCHDISPSVQSFSVAMAERDYDESPKAAVVARHVGNERHNVLSMTQSALMSAFTDLMTKMDEPHGDPGFVNHYFLAGECRPHITVALGGDGADELFGGYAPFQGLPLQPLMERLPKAAVGLSRAMAKCLPGSDTYMGLQFKALAYLQGFPSTRTNRHSLWLSTLAPEELTQLLPRAGRDFFDPMRAAGAFDVAADLHGVMASGTPTQQMLYYYQRVFLPEFICHHTDRAAMLHGLEVRSPFLSVPMIEFANRLPDALKVHRGGLKRVLREILARRQFPAEILNQGKHGFTFPLARWLKEDMRGLVDDLADVGALSGGEVDGDAFRRMTEQHLSGRRNLYRIIYNMIVFRAWRMRYPSLEFS